MIAELKDAREYPKSLALLQIIDIALYIVTELLTEYPNEKSLISSVPSSRVAECP